METIYLNAYHMVDREAAHVYLKEKLGLPEYYGGNLDALWDCLTEMRDICVVLKHRNFLVRELGEYGEQMIRVFCDAAGSVEGFQFKEEGLEDDEGKVVYD